MKKSLIALFFIPMYYLFLFGTKKKEEGKGVNIHPLLPISPYQLN